MSLIGAYHSNTESLKSQSIKMKTIATNVANVSTQGYKKTDILFASQLGPDAKHPPHVKSVKANIFNRIDQSGPLVSTSKNLDLAISGKGMFVTKNPEKPSEYNFTRDGGFSTVVKKENGQDVLYLSTKLGQYLQGWAVDKQGNHTTSTALGSLSDVKFSFQNTDAAIATSSVNVRAALPGSVEPGHTELTSTQIFDEKGELHTVNIEWKKTVNPREWLITLTSPDAAQPALGSTLLTFDSQTGGLLGAPSIGFTPQWTNGSPSVAAAFSFNDSVIKGEHLSINDIQRNGQAKGFLQNVSFDSKGYLIGQFSNNTNQKLYKIPYAIFTNTNGLDYMNGDHFATSSNSGAATLKDPEQSKIGEYKVQTIESSNVNLGDEMTKMIITHRAYSTAATGFKTIDEMMSTLIRDVKQRY